MELGLDNALGNAPPPFPVERDACKLQQDHAAAVAGVIEEGVVASNGNNVDVGDNGVINSESDSDEDFGPETAVDADDLDSELRNNEPAPPTPPAHTVEEIRVDGATADNVAESGEESEDEWNYYKGQGVGQNKRDEQNLSEGFEDAPRSETPFQDNSACESSSVDMNSSPLNPDAPVFVPGTVGGSDILLAESPRKPQPMDDIELPDEGEFETEAVARPAELLDIDSTDQHNGHHNLSVDELSKGQFNGNMDSLGFGFNVGEEPEKVVDATLETFERIQKDTTDFCDIQVFQTHTETNPFNTESNDELLERLKNKERDPMSMSFYQEKDDDTCERFTNNDSQVDLNAVQPLPDSDEDDEIQLNGTSHQNELGKENVCPDKISNLLDFNEPNNDIFDDREVLVHNVTKFEMGDNFAAYSDSTPSEHVHHTNLDFESGIIPEPTVVQTDTPESHKLLFEQIPEIPDGKSSELGFVNDDTQDQSESENEIVRTITPQDMSQQLEESQKIPCLETQSELTHEFNELIKSEQNSESKQEILSQFADIFHVEAQQPQEISADSPVSSLRLEEEGQLSVSPLPKEDICSETLAVSSLSNVIEDIEQSLRVSPMSCDGLVVDTSGDHVSSCITDQFALSPELCEKVQCTESLSKSPIPTDDNLLEKKINICPAVQLDTGAEAIEENFVTSPVPEVEKDIVMNIESDCILQSTPQFNVSISPEPTETNLSNGLIPDEQSSQTPVAQSPVPSEALIPSESPVPSYSPVRTYSPVPAYSPIPSQSPLPTETCTVEPHSPFLSKPYAEIPLPAEVPLPRDSPTPSEEPQMAVSPLPVESTDLESIIQTNELTTHTSSEPLPEMLDMKSVHELHVRLSPEVPAQNGIDLHHEESKVAELISESTPDLLPGDRTQARSELVTDIDIGIPESRAQEICEPITNEINHEDAIQPGATPPPTPAVEDAQPTLTIPTSLDIPALSDTVNPVDGSPADQQGEIAETTAVAVAATAAVAVATTAAAISKSKSSTVKKSPTTSSKTIPKTTTKSSATAKTPVSATKSTSAKTTPLTKTSAAAKTTPISKTTPVTSKAPVAKSPMPVAKSTTVPATKPAAPLRAPMTKPPAKAPLTKSLPKTTSTSAPTTAKEAPATKTAAMRPTSAPIKSTVKAATTAPKAARPLAAKPKEFPTKTIDKKSSSAPRPATAPAMAPAASRTAPRPAARATLPNPAGPPKASVPRVAARPPSTLDKQTKDITNKRMTAKAAPPRTATAKVPPSKTALTKSAPKKSVESPKKDKDQTITNGLTNGSEETEHSKSPLSPPAVDNAQLPDVIA